MSRSTQDKVMAALKAAAESYDLDLVIDTNYSNQGYVRFEPYAMGSEPVLSFEFNFQPTYWTLDHIKPVLPGLRDPDEKGRQGAGCWPPEYRSGDRPEVIIMAIRNHLARLHLAKQEASLA